MAEEIRTDEEPEVEGHGLKGDIDEGFKGAQEDESDDVEGHAFTHSVKEAVKDNLKEGHKA
jgi:hypothetical protein